MRSQILTSGAGVVLLLLASAVSAKQSVHEHLHALHHRFHNRDVAQSAPEVAEQGIEVRSAPSEKTASGPEIEKRGGQCAFPSGEGLVPVTPGSQNAGWAMSPNQPCTPGNYCPYACPPGEVSVQWDPSATSYTYPKSMNGGLYCDSNGNIQKPFPDKPYCQSTAANIGVVNNCGSQVSFCQTVLPGNEAMLIPTAVLDFATLAVPDTSYWAKTAAHYYINPPGVDTDTACVWGTSANPWGNWSPYVAGANIDSSGETFIKLGWNPIYLEPTTPFRNSMPTWGVKIDCPDGGCNGLPCAIDPSQDGVNEMNGGQAIGAGGGNFCVVTVAKGSTANFVVFESGGSQDDDKGGQFYQSSSAASSTSPSTSSEAASSSSASAWSDSLSSSETPSSSSSPSSSPSSSSPASISFSSSPSSSSSSSSSSSAGSSLTAAWTAGNSTTPTHSFTGSKAGPTAPTSKASATQYAGGAGNSTSPTAGTASPSIVSSTSGGAAPAPGWFGGMLLAAAAAAALACS